MSRIKYLSFALCLVASAATAAFDPAVVVGQWAAYQKNLLSADYYYFLNINPDFSGTLVENRVMVKRLGLIAALLTSAGIFFPEIGIIYAL